MKILIMNKFDILKTNGDLNREIEQAKKFILTPSPFNPYNNKEKEIEFVTLERPDEYANPLLWLSDAVKELSKCDDVVLPLYWMRDRHCKAIYEICRMYAHQTIQVEGDL